jgi:hypothetical protein
MSGFRFDLFQSKLGGGIQGAQPKGGLLGGGASSTGGSGMEGGGDRGTERFVLRKAFGNQTLPNGTNPIYDAKPITPFRAAYNAGDTNGTVNSAPLASMPGSDQVNGNSRVSRLNIRAGGRNSNGGAAYSGNPRYVYDSSNYIQYRKLRAVNKTYNDSNFGGDQSNGSYVALRGVRRF